MAQSLVRVTTIRKGEHSGYIYEVSSLLEGEQRGLSGLLELAFLIKNSDGDTIVAANSKIVNKADLQSELCALVEEAKAVIEEIAAQDAKQTAFERRLPSLIVSVQAHMLNLMDVDCAHLTTADMEWLAMDTPEHPRAIPHRDGVLVVVCEDEEIHKSDMAAINEHASQSFAQIFELAFRSGAHWINFDQDGEFYETIAELNGYMGEP